MLSKPLCNSSIATPAVANANSAAIAHLLVPLPLPPPEESFSDDGGLPLPPPSTLFAFSSVVFGFIVLFDDLSLSSFILFSCLFVLSISFRFCISSADVSSMTLFILLDILSDNSLTNFSVSIFISPKA